jgi:hypothetical protein
MSFPQSDGKSSGCRRGADAGTHAHSARAGIAVVALRASQARRRNGAAGRRAAKRAAAAQVRKLGLVLQRRIRHAGRYRPSSWQRKNDICTCRKDQDTSASGQGDQEEGRITPVMTFAIRSRYARSRRRTL